MNPIVGVLESLPATKSVVIYKRSRKDFYKVDFKRLPLQGRLAHKWISRKDLDLD
jgi:hypothetical protein